MEQVCIAAVGDISTGFDPPETAFDHVMGSLRNSDIRFAHVERLYSERGSHQQQSITKHARQHPRMAEAFKSVPFDAVSIASNRSGDWGPEAVEDTIETLRALGVPAVGAGRNINEARAPAIVVRNGIRVAFLAYASVLLPQTWASETRPGCAPMRARTYYEPYEFQPGAPARVVTIPHSADLEQLIDDVGKAKQQADIVFVSFHWGVHFIPRPCDYQPVVAHAAIDAGASVIFGHHPHQQQGLEVYKKAIIFYAMGNFVAYKVPGRGKHVGYTQPNGEFTFQEVYSLEPDPGFHFDFQRHYNESSIAYIELDSDGLRRVSLLPTLLNETGQPQVVTPDQPQFEKSLTYLNWCGKFIKGGVTQMRAADGRYEAYVR